MVVLALTVLLALGSPALAQPLAAERARGHVRAAHAVVAWLARQGL